jgi:hypothetical protein
MDPNDEFDEASEEGWVAEQRRTVADYFVMECPRKFGPPLD